MSVENFLSYKKCRYLHTTEEDLEAMLFETNREGKFRVITQRDQNGKIHSGWK